MRGRLEIRHASIGTFPGARVDPAEIGPGTCGLRLWFVHTFDMTKPAPGADIESWKPYAREPFRVRLAWDVARLTDALTMYESDRPEYYAAAVRKLLEAEAWADRGVLTIGGREGFRFAFPGDRNADQVSEARILPPKVRKGIELRYRDGHGWEKYLKSSGWTWAGEGIEAEASKAGGEVQAMLSGLEAAV